jgi:hypothetical protein
LQTTEPSAIGPNQVWNGAFWDPRAGLFGCSWGAKADRDRSTPRRRLLGKRHREPRACVHPVRLRFSRRQADDRLLRLQFAIIIAAG